MADHFHVHIVHVNHEGSAGLTVGQAHMLDSLITLVSDVTLPLTVA
jgi:m7GpppX diphosphatase